MWCGGTHTRTHMHSYTYTCIHTHTLTHIHMHTYTHTHTFTCTHIYIHTHSHTHGDDLFVCVCVFGRFGGYMSHFLGRFQPDAIGNLGEGGVDSCVQAPPTS